MSAPTEPVVCRGAPRDLGLDQGLAAREVLRRELGAATLGSRLAWRLRLPAAAARADRDVRRYFPHLAERLEGLARGAGVPRAAVAARLARSAAEPAASALLAAEPSRTGAGALVARAVPAELVRKGAWLVRRSEPEHDYRSVELAAPWGLAALAGVNEHGLAAAATSAAPADGAADSCAAPAELLVQDCLQRFDSVEKAVEWCTRRPAGGRTRIVLADAAGHLAAVDVGGASRPVRAAEAGVLLGMAPDAVSSALAKAAAARPQLRAGSVAEVLAEATGPDALQVLLDPAGRRLGLVEAGAGEPRWFPAASQAAADAS